VGTENGNYNLNTILDYFIHSNIYIALSGAICAYGVALSLGLPLTPTILIVEFSAVLSFYSLNRYMEFKQDLETYPSRTKFIKNRMHLFTAMILFFYSLTLLLCFLQNINSLIFILLLTVLTVIYSSHIASFRIKDILFAKNIFLGIVWSITVVIFPQFFYQMPIINKTLYYAIFIWLLTTINTIVFDLRDFSGDKKNNIQTIPVVFGTETTKKIVASMAAISLIFSIALYLDLGKECIPFILTSLCMLITISRIGVDDIRLVTEIYTDAWWGIFGFFSLLWVLI
jgi:4-hydroxybenzoate polyprenyltransferase